MSTPTIEAVVAGSKGFAIALLVPLTERVGVRPRIAVDATQALGLVKGPNGIAVLEVQGDATVAAIEALLPERSGLRVIAAVPEALAGLEARLLAAGAELARWDGNVLGVLEALGRLTDRQAAAPAPMPMPSAPAAAPPRAAAPPSRPAPAPAAAAAARAPVLVPHPASAGARAPARPAAPAVAPGPALTPSRPMQPVTAALTPSRPMQPASPVLTPSRPMQPVTAALTPSRPMQPASPALTPSRPMQPVSPALAPSRPASATASVDALFDNLEADVDVEPTAPAAPRHTPAPLRPSAAAAPVSTAWPAGGPTSDEAETALASALAGAGAPSSPLGAVASQVSAALSDLERAALQGAPIPLDAAIFRRAAGMRVRVAAALATVPPSGGPVDAAALSALLGEIDALLSTVAAAAKEAPQRLMPSLEAVRNALVKEAIDFSEAAQRVAPAGAQPLAEKAVKSARAAQARVLSVTSEQEPPETRRHVGAWVVLGIALALGAGFHGFRLVEKKRAIADAPTMSGQPAGMLLLPTVPGAPRSIVRLPGAHVERAEIERFKSEQRAKGFEVAELPSGELVVKPGRAELNAR